jgi:hypothetical protein
MTTAEGPRATSEGRLKHPNRAPVPDRQEIFGASAARPGLREVGRALGHPDERSLFPGAPRRSRPRPIRETSRVTHPLVHPLVSAQSTPGCPTSGPILPGHPGPRRPGGPGRDLRLQPRFRDAHGLRRRRGDGPDRWGPRPSGTWPGASRSTNSSTDWTLPAGCGPTWIGSAPRRSPKSPAGTWSEGAALWRIVPAASKRRHDVGRAVRPDSVSVFFEIVLTLFLCLTLFPCRSDPFSLRRRG